VLFLTALSLVEKNQRKQRKIVKTEDKKDHLFGFHVLFLMAFSLVGETYQIKGNATKLRIKSSFFGLNVSSSTIKLLGL